jgi:enoyl-[acyl-carrier-protein] reductase (NADH)
VSDRSELRWKLTPDGHPRRTPLKKVATSLDVANQIVVLSSSTVSGHVTGQVVMIDGGMEGTLLNKPEEV